MRGDLILALARSLADDDYARRAIAMIEKACELAQPMRPAWWQWTIYLSAAMSIERIRKARGQ